MILCSKIYTCAYITFNFIKILDHENVVVDKTFFLIILHTFRDFEKHKQRYNFCDIIMHSFRDFEKSSFLNNGGG